MIGETFSQLTVLERVENQGRRAQYLCACSCGNRTKVVASRLRSGKTKSCGCRRASNMRAVATKHGDSSHPLYTRWLRMMSRCYNAEDNRFYRYGGRGIKVCQRWRVFRNYAEDLSAGYSPGLTVDRVDNDGDYTPGNIRWATYQTQARNRSSSRVSECTIAKAKALYTETALSQRQVADALGLTRDAVKIYLRGLRAR